jgi:MFS family permease
MTPSPGIAPPWGLAWRLAFGQIFSWGIHYYAFTVVVGPMQAGTGWSRTFLNFGLSIGLLMWGLCAYPVGLWIQRRGARGLMTAGSIAGAIALILMGSAITPAAYLVAWVLLGAAMAGSLYDPAFAVITATFGAHFRRGITLITLVGGLASTVFIPLAQFAVNHTGWRTALILLGAVQLVVCAPLHWLSIPTFSNASRRDAASTTRKLAAWWSTFRSDVSDRRFVGLAIWFTAYSTAFTGLVFQLIPMLQSLEVANHTIVTAIAVMGPMQVAGRLFLSVRGQRFPTLHVGAFAMSALALAMLMLLLLPPTLFWLALFAAVLGLGNGMLTIVRGTSVGEVFGLERYAEINGALAAPGVLAKAAAPLVLASIWSATGSARSVPLVALLLLVIGGCGLFYLIRVRMGERNAAASSAAAPVITA